MDITLKLFIKWCLLVSLSAVASFVAAVLTDYSGVVKIIAMLAGIISFACIYTFIEAWAILKMKHEFLTSLKVGVLVKVALQLIPAIEVFTGAFAVWLVDLLNVHNHFVSVYLKTMVTGSLLSLVVFAIAALYAYLVRRFGVSATRIERIIS